MTFLLNTVARNLPEYTLSLEESLPKEEVQGNYFNFDKTFMEYVFLSSVLCWIPLRSEQEVTL